MILFMQIWMWSLSSQVGDNDKLQIAGKPVMER